MRFLTFGPAVALAMAFGLAAAAAVGAQEPASEGGGTEDEDRRVRRLPVFGVLDADDDDEISTGEIDAAAQSLATLDDDGDGGLAGDELRPRPPGPIGGPARTPADATAAFMRLDADEDGALDRTELPSQFLSLLSRADAGGDGAASEAEILALMTAEAAGPGDPDRPAEEGEEDSEPAAEAGADGERPRPAIPLMTALDADGDGAVSESEIASAAQSLRALDADGDGRLTLDELRPAAAGASDRGSRQE